MTDINGVCFYELYMDIVVVEYYSAIKLALPQKYTQPWKVENVLHYYTYLHGSEDETYFIPNNVMYLH